MTEQLVPARRVSPGRILRRELDARGWSQKDLAAIIQRPEQAISEIVNDKKRITPPTAVELAHAFGTSPELWMNLDSSYQLWLARKAETDKLIARRARLYDLAPIPELIRRRWIPDTNDIGGLEEAVCELLEIPSPDATPSYGMSPVNMRISPSRGPEAAAQIAWVKRAEKLTRMQPAERFTRAKLRKSIPVILACAERAGDMARVPPMLLRLGVRFVVVPHLRHTYIDGALLRCKEGPAVALTLRYDRIDSFWFTLLHELGHLAQGHSGTFLDTIFGREHKAVGEEAEADKLAQDWLIPSAEYRKFIEATGPYYSRQNIEDFAKRIERHPGIVLGRLQYDREVGYNHLRFLLVKGSAFLTGWMDGPTCEGWNTSHRTGRIVC